MIRFFLIVALVTVFGVGVVWATQSFSGVVTIPWVDGDLVDIHVAVAALAVVFLGGIMALVWWMCAKLINLPGTIGTARQTGKQRKANRALADGLLAAEAGDSVTAMKLAKKAAAHADDERLKLLLEARAAESTEKWADAERAWSQLSMLPGGQLAGLRGAAMAAAERGDTAEAETRTQKALELNSSASWPFQSLFEYQVARADWEKAIGTLGVGAKRGLMVGDQLRRRRAVLLTAHAVEVAKNGDRGKAQKTLAEAIKSAPGFPPSVWHGARQLMIDGKVKPAQTILELGWKARPHPALAQLARRIVPQEKSVDTKKRLQSLLSANPDHRESRILETELALENGDSGKALEILGYLTEEQVTTRLCQLMETASRMNGDSATADKWRAMIATASREADWSDLDPRGGAFDFSDEEWSRLVYRFGDVGELIHARYEAFGQELDMNEQIALPAPVSTAAPSNGKPALETPKAEPESIVTPPLSYVVD